MRYLFAFILNICCLNVSWGVIQTPQRQLSSLIEEVYLLTQEVKRIGAEQERIVANNVQLQKKVAALEDLQKNCLSLATQIEALNALQSKYAILETQCEDLQKNYLSLATKIEELSALQSKCTTLETQYEDFLKKYAEFEQRCASSQDQVQQVCERCQLKILSDVNERIQDLAQQMQEGFDKIVQMEQVANTPADYYPQTGIMYEIKSGDSLASIAQKLNSRTEYIRAANKISDPKQLKVGDKIFIPKAIQ
ncbi:MAG: LysM peptidoglycan-binding domain-containing protein [Puniceicoccales bacterium]|jgi:chromosome segregation ATPase|nr:LysM peptidoglycan-binding domain-containing protein [Puniceicoccales bacterium]